MMLVDSNVLIDVWQNDPLWFEWSSAQLRSQSLVHELVINPVVYSELSMSFSTYELLEEAVTDLQLHFAEIPRLALHLAGKAFSRYRKSQGAKINVLADFFIGAHAAVAHMPILTRDRRRYATYFPTVQLITPHQ